jgi:hypothetical protein
MSYDGFLNLDFKLIVAGAAGGISILYSITEPSAKELLAGVIVGGLVANYVTQAAVADPSTPWAWVVAFSIGTAGKWLCRRAFEYVKSKFTFFKER